MSQQSIPHDYYYGSEAEQYTFYRLPKILFTDAQYKRLSDGAKILYGLMLDRMGLSLKNGWLDERNRVYIYFTLEDVQEYMNCQRDKGMKLLAELDSVKGVGLIERVKQGLGKPAITYVKKFIGTPDLQKSEKPTSGLHDLPTSGLHDLPTSGLRQNRPLVVGNIDPNKTDSNNTDFNDTEYQSIYQRKRSEKEKPIDRIDTISAYSEIIKENISYDYLCKQDNIHAYEIHELFEIMLETVCSTRETIRVGREDMPAEIVKSRLLKLDYSHIEYVMDSMDKTTTDVRDIRSYLLTALYRSPTTITNKYKAEVNHDLHTAQPPT